MKQLSNPKSNPGRKPLARPGISSPESKSFPVAGIGASAGGLEAYTQLLQSLPADTGMGFVLVQHLDPTRESALTEILAKATAMPVCEVTDELPVQPNHVYIIPPNASLGIERGVLKLHARPEVRGAHRTIDGFFESLAQDQHEQAIGVVLSGAASDGTHGLEAIKAEGGITLAQDDSAAYDSMPRSAIASGCVDFVLSPRDIAAELARIARHPCLAAALPPEARAPAAQTSQKPLADGPVEQASPPPIEAQAAPGAREEFKKVLLLLRHHSGVDFSLYKATTVQRRILRRMVLSRLDTLPAYAQFLRGNPQELGALYSDMLINVTSFFRNPKAFEFLEREVFPKLLQQNREDPIRAWVAGCSTGQEAYSLVMACLEAAGQAGDTPKLQVFATDLNEHGLEKARAGLYPKTVVQDVSPERLRRFFIAEEQGYRIAKSIREMVLFARQNLLSDPPFSRLDLISCRNLLIYLEPDLQHRLVPLFHYALKPEGLLFLGASESISSFTELFEPVDKKHRLFRKKTAPTPALHLHFAPRHPAMKTQVPTPEPAGTPEAPSPEFRAQREADRLAVNRYAPPGVLVNAEWQILQFRGDTSPFLKPPTGKATFDLLNMAREELRSPLRSALNRAKEQNQTVREEGARVHQNGHTRTVNLEVVPLKNLKVRCYLICFEPAEQPVAGRGTSSAPAHPPSPEGGPAGSPPAENTLGGEAAGAQRRVAELELELAEARDYLQSVQEQNEAANEELQAANEEVTSANEELQSINEELETSKEELESTNEELTTLNEEMAHRNRELQTLNSDLLNFQTSADVAVVLLGRDLAIRRFTPLAAKVFNLLATDAGRLLTSVRHNLDCPDLEPLVAEVIETISGREREIQDQQGRWYSLRVRPYLTVDNKIDGAVLVLGDIDALKRADEVLRVNESRLKTLLQISQQAMDLEENAIIQRILEEAVLLTRSKIGYFHVLNEDQNTTRLCAWSEEVLKTSNAVHQTHYRLDQAGVWADCARLKRPVIHNDCANLPNQRDYPAGLSPVIRHLSLPVVEQDQVRILLGVGDKATDYNAADQDLLALIAQDGWSILSRKRAETALRRVSDQRRLALESANLGTWDFNLLTGEVCIGERFREIFGVSVALAAMRYEDIRARIHPEDQAELDRAVKRATSADSTGAYALEYRVVWPDGTVRGVLAKGQAYFEGQGQARRAVRFIGTVMDITERKAAEQALRLSETRFRALADNIPQLVWTALPDGRIDYVNRQCADYTGLTAVEQLGEKWLDRVHSEDRAGASTRWTLAVATKAFYDSEHRLKNARGQFRWFKVRGIPIFDSAGRCIKWFGTCTDIEDQKRAKEILEQTVAERTAKLREMVGELEHFSYSITHDMRAPLRAMQSFAHMMLQDNCADCLRATPKDYLRRIAMAAGRMDLQITDALQYSQAIRSELTLKPVDAAALLRGILESYPNLQPPGADIRLAGEFPLVLGNKAALTQCFSNLLDNAVKFVAPGTVPQVRVWAELVARDEPHQETNFEPPTSDPSLDSPPSAVLLRRTGPPSAVRPRRTGQPSTLRSTAAEDGSTSNQFVRLWFEDNGIGIPKRCLARIFDMFQQIVKSHDSTGIGLALVRKNIERMGGRIGVESEAGKGSRFWLDLRKAE
jgi:two-component system CheB/CheR fusion protein